MNGWSIAPIVALQSGATLSMSSGKNNKDDSTNANRPNLVSGVGPFLDPHRDRSVNRKAWFVQNEPGVPGGIGPGGVNGNSPRNSLRAPGYRDIDLGLFRDFRFERGLVFQIRGEATNAFNLISLSAPTAALTSGNDRKLSRPPAPSDPGRSAADFLIHRSRRNAACFGAPVERQNIPLAF